MDTKEYLTFFQHLKAPLEQTFGEWGPWAFLVLLVVAAELLVDFVLAPWLRKKGAAKLADTVQADGNKLRSGALVAVFAGGTTLDIETALLGVISGGVTVALLRWKEIREFVALQMLWPVVLLVASPAFTGCTVPLERARTAGIAERSGGEAVGYADAPERCHKLDNARTNAGIVWKVSGSVATVAGGSSIPIGQEDESAQLALAITAGAAAAIAAGAAYAQERKSESWARECADR